MTWITSDLQCVMWIKKYVRIKKEYTCVYLILMFKIFDRFIDLTFLQSSEYLISFINTTLDFKFLSLVHILLTQWG